METVKLLVVLMSETSYLCVPIFNLPIFPMIIWIQARDIPSTLIWIYYHFSKQMVTICFSRLLSTSMILGAPQRDQNALVGQDIPWLYGTKQPPTLIHPIHTITVLLYGIFNVIHPFISRFFSSTFLWWLLTKILLCISHVHACYTSHPPHPPRFNHPNNTRERNLCTSWLSVLTAPNISVFG